MYYVIADTHFYHDMMIEKGYRPSDYNNLLFKSLSQITKWDTLIHLGDLSFYRNDEINRYIETIIGKKILLRGNHDKKSHSYYEGNGWTFVADEIMIKRGGYDIVFSHKPVPISGDKRINIHGHFHTTLDSHHKDEYSTTDNHILISMEEKYLFLQVEVRVDMKMD